MPKIFRIGFGVIYSILLFHSISLGNEVFEGQVISVTDGDSITVLKDKERFKVRLLGIDCPERGQPFGGTAKKFTSDVSFHKNVTVIWQKRDRYNRILGEIILPDGRNLNHELVRAGLAWHYKRYSNDEVLNNLEMEAHQKKVGLWLDESAVPPWDWRRGERDNWLPSESNRDGPEPTRF